jgi:Transposase DDE domain
MHYTLTPHAVHSHAAQVLRRHLRLTDFSPRCTAHMLLAVVFCACARLCSLFAAAKGLLAAPSPETVRKALLASLPEQDELERRLNRALLADVPKPLRRRKQRLAADLILIPYHGQPQKDEAEVYRGPAKHGTTHFHAYATLYVVYRGQRFTVALTAVRRGETMEAVLQRLLRRAARAGVRPQLLLLDRGFCSVGVIRYLQAARYPFLMPLPLRGRTAEHPKGASGSRVFQYAKRSGFDSYTLHDEDGRPATVGVCVVCQNEKGRRGRRGRRRLVYAFWGFRPSSCAWVRETYRTRFGVESSYRQLNEARARTCTRDPAVRLFLVGVALVLRNVWVWLHWEVLAHPRRGGRRLDLAQLTFRAMLLWLQHLAEELLGVCDEVQATRPILT